MLKTLGRYYRTIKHLKPVQIRYRLWYAVRGYGSVTVPGAGGEGASAGRHRGTGPRPDIPAGQPDTRAGQPLTLEKGLRPRRETFSPDGGPRPQVTGGDTDAAGTFTFLNRSHTFRGGIDWDFDGHGALWTYNLNYHDCLRQPGMTAETGLALIRDFIGSMRSNRTGMLPYPISLRGVNWIFFLTRHGVEDPHVDAALHAQYKLLSRSPEYHLMGNHLLENGCSLLFGACYFRERKWLAQARQILERQLEEQVLADGGHFERSTMYHAILLERLLDCYNLVSRNRDAFWEGEPADAGETLRGTLEQQIKESCSLMLGWMEQVWMESGRMPLLNDAARGIAPSREALRDYASRLGIPTVKRPLSESGYRRYCEGPLELVADVGEISPDYITGHAHSDTLSFVLDTGNEPVIIDPGVSTYENNAARQRERSTAFHNTVMVDNREQSEIWSTFRVGRRARITLLEEETAGREDRHRLSASHDGFRSLGIIHGRTWEIGPGGIVITDMLEGRGGRAGEEPAGSESAGTKSGTAVPAGRQSVAFLHFAPRLEPEPGEERQTIRIPLSAGALEVAFENASSVALEKYSCPDGYNQYLPAVKAVVTFSDRLVTRISHFE